MSKDKTKGKSKPTRAGKADKYKLYLKSVQEPDHEVDFLARAYKAAYGRGPKVLREDFCGTYAVCCRWVNSGPQRQAIGVDFDPQPLAWGTEHNLSKLDPGQRKRVSLIQADVRDVTGPKADVLAAQNFSFWVFKTRDELRGYFQAAHDNLRRKGVMVLDLMGGPDLWKEDHQDVKSYKKFKYIWDQQKFDPITHECLFHIHFRFKDGSELRRAFTYDWRLWTIPEVREILAEVGFRRIDVYWEGTDEKTGEGNGVYRRRKHAPSEPTWIAYVAAAK